MGKPNLTYRWFLPVEGETCPDQRWRVVYTDGLRTLPVEVCAPDEGTAMMRAGMKRAELTKWDRFFDTYPKWEKVSSEAVA
jgi:hypothetical protein